MASRKAAESTLYHFSPKGFWKKFRTTFLTNDGLNNAYYLSGDAVVVNPEISSGLPLPSINRMPPPGSRPEAYATPATKGLSSDQLFPLKLTQPCPASDPAQNPYWKRDVRRAYPQLSVVTQSELATFLLQSPEQ